MQLILIKDPFLFLVCVFEKRRGEKSRTHDILHISPQLFQTPLYAFPMSDQSSLVTLNYRQPGVFWCLGDKTKTPSIICSQSTVEIELEDEEFSLFNNLQVLQRSMISQMSWKLLQNKSVEAAATFVSISIHLKMQHVKPAQLESPNYFLPTGSIGIKLLVEISTDSFLSPKNHLPALFLKFHSHERLQGE